MTLTDFVLARIAEDERLADIAQNGAWGISKVYDDVYSLDLDMGPEHAYGVGADCYDEEWRL